jgi:thiamine-phosphate pyrophosphorylase
MCKYVAITNRSLTKRPFLEQLRRICETKPEFLILREKDLSQPEYTALATQVLTLCQEFQVPCNLHFFTETAKELSCRRIHLPLWRLQELSLPERKAFTVLGASVHSVEEACLAESLGATYITAGHIFATDCKKGLAPRGLDFLRAVCQAVSIPVYAIGGIHFDEAQLQTVMKCGAAGACVMSEYMKL